MTTSAQEVLTTTHHPINLDNQTVYASVLTYEAPIEAPPEESEKMVAGAYQALADDLKTQDGADKQRSACLISDLTPIGDYVTLELMQAWYDSATADNVRTQKQLLEIFERPTFGILVNPNITEKFVRENERKINASANPTYVRATLDEALELAEQLLAMAHR